jgi:hypothetical protein
MRLLLSAVILSLLSGAAAAASVDPRAGTSGAQFLKLGSGARAGAMADSYSAIADDVWAVYYNPAGLNQLKGAQLGGAHTAYFQGVNYETFNFAVPYSKQDGFSRHAVGFGVYQLSVTDIERRANDTTDALGTFGASDGAYSLSYSYAVSRRFSAGGTGKYIVQSIDSYKASAYAMDAGLLFKPNPDAPRAIAVAAVIRNIGSRPKFAGASSDPLPTSVTLGASVYAVPKKLRLNLDAVKYRDTSAFGALGAEYTRDFNDIMSGALRLGYTSQRRATPGLNGVTAGGGLTFRKASFDFAWIPFGVLGDTFRYSLVIKF